ncbi:MAG: Mov34/MPN/PAD-1 family protein [Planctomycetota bacterium]
MEHSPAPKLKTRKDHDDDEECWVLLGQRRDRVWAARRTSYTVGEPHAVAFDHAAVLEREERRGDIVGFYHTHPVGHARPSRRDLITMRAWVGSFGKPLLCVIEGIDGLVGYRFDDDEAEAEPLLVTERFPRNLVIGVDHG